MKAIHAAVAIAVGLIVALWWAVQPPRFTAPPLPSIDGNQQLQCPAGSRLDGKLCVCPPGTSWSGSACSVAR